MNRMLLSGAIFNWAIALAFLFAIAPLFQLMQIAPIPGERLFVDLFAVLVFVFGIGYYWAARDVAGNRPILRLAMWAKLAIFVLVPIEVLAGQISWPILIPSTVDGIYALLFWRLLHRPV
jgi:hypothetical protein